MAKKTELKQIIVNNDPKSTYSESIRSIRTNLQFSSINKELQVLLVTSPEPGDGKSFTTANLATAYAQDGKKVLIIDCDLRKGRQHKLFKLNSSRGLSNLLISNKNYSEYINKTQIENLYVIPRFPLSNSTSLSTFTNYVD